VTTGDGGELAFSGYIDGRTRARVTQPAVASHGYLTPQDRWGDVERGNPLPYTLPPEQRRAVGLEPETWQLEVVADPETDAEVASPLTRAAGTAIDFDALLRIGAEHGVRILKGVTCNNIGEPLGMGLWEGVPLRVLVWMAQPVRNIRRVFYYGYHNDDPVQMFQSSLPIGRVLEEPPGELPVIVAYRLNGELISGRRGGPVRLVVPEAYGFKSVKWLQRVVLTNKYAANDTYHEGNNDLDSPMKTFARFSHVPNDVRAGSAVEISGIAQVGMSGLARVEYWLRSVSPGADGDEEERADPYCLRGDWRPAEIVDRPPDLGNLALSSTVQASEWPLRYTFVQWRAGLPGLAPGAYELRCRSVDRNGVAQPMPRPFPKSGRAEIQVVKLSVTG
jgi:DMSO/TMAO reductase YedYZ molybdopterin-dependent catalytic subunit